MTKYVSLIIRAITSVTAFFLLVWVNCNFFTAGTIIGSALFGGAFLACVFQKPLCRLVKRIWSKIAGRVVLLTLGAVTAVCAVCCTVFSVNMALCAERPLDDAQAVIVLGCQVRGETPSTMLQKRCDAAIEVLSAHPNAVCVVSGGQGKGEDISEAEAMRRYLKERGVLEERVIIEEKSTSTRENIRYSAELLKERGLDRAVIVTNDFHQFRAELYARRNGLTVGHHSNKTPRYNLLNYWVREWAALFSAVIFG